MRTVEFKTRLADGTLRIPQDVASQIPADQDLTVIVAVGAPDDKDWLEASARSLLDIFEPEDAIYDAIYGPADSR